ncbi:pentapeptide repeat-containing protein [Rathayibacter sp. AY1D5]|uniref:pentapeptide repeat-containing protein n=1 Tax=Rathayibacter sp. AY1D5 TaxID=2080546 RepID=UPI0011B04021|nr:pentapeptide repeat-containing protein [Rathayibacter sp. AY1D5]
MTASIATTLTASERAVLLAARRGVVEDLRLRGQEERRIRGELLRLLLTAPGELGEPSPVAVRLRGARITGSLNVGDRSIICPLALEECAFDRPLILTKARASNISLRGSKMRGLSARHIVMSGALNLAEGFECRGQVNLFGARMARVEAVGGRFINPNGKSLNGNYLHVEGFASFEDTIIKGVVQLIGATVNGQLDFTGARVESAAEFSIELDSASIHGGIEFQNATVNGGIWLVGLVSRGELAFHEASILAPGLRAIDASSADLGAVILSDATIVGEVKIAGSRLRVLDCTDTTLKNEGKTCLDLDGSTVSGPVHALFKEISGRLDLTNATMETYRDTQSSWPTSAQLIGVSIGRLRGDEEADGANRDALRSRLEWIKLDDRYHPEKYAAVADAYRNVGRGTFATQVLMAGKREAAVSTKGPGKIMALPLSLLLRVTVGYGYRLERALGWLLSLIVLGSLLIDAANKFGLFRAKESNPPFNSVLFAIDLLFPVVSLGQADAFIACGWVQWLTATMSLLGWLLGAIVVAALAGLLQRKQV